MNRISRRIFVIAMASALAVPGMRVDGQTLEDIQRTQPVVVADGVLSYIYGYPLMMFGVTGRTGTTVPNDMTKLGAAPLNQFGKEMRLPDAKFTAVVLPSTSTLYASSFLNLCIEPVILHLPNMNGRFFIMQMLDGWTEVSPDSPGSNKGSGEGDYALVGPPCQGNPTQPIPGTVVKTINIPTSSMWIIGRIYTDGTQCDIDYVTKTLYRDLTLTPLSKYNAGEKVVSENQPVQPYADTVTPPLKQVAGMDACAFYQNLAAMMNFNLPIAVQDDIVLPSLLRLGLVTRLPPDQGGGIAGTNFDCTALRADKLASLQQSVVLAKNLLENVNPTRPTRTGWTVSLNVGTYGRRYFLRAEVAQDALGANRKEDAVYGYTQTDARRIPLNGRRKYKIHFAASGNEGIPPVVPGGFWSLTIYDTDGKLVPPPDPVNANWNAVGMPPVNGHKACPNNDGSLDLYLQADAPPLGSQEFCNWLPTPSKGGYIAFLRMYWPNDDIQNGDWIPPGIEPN